MEGIAEQVVHDVDTAPTGRPRKRLVHSRPVLSQTPITASVLDSRAADEMVQGAPKGLQKKKSDNARHAAKAAAATKKGQRYAAPKKAQAVKTAALHKVSFLACRTAVNC
jgi:hypothetical protein